jgi:hypothetical protein
MQGKALVVNPAVIHPSATPTIVVGRAREKARKSRVRNRKFEKRPEPGPTTISLYANQMVTLLAGP